MAGGDVGGSKIDEFRRFITTGVGLFSIFCLNKVYKCKTQIKYCCYKAKPDLGRSTSPNFKNNKYSPAF